MDAKIVGLDRVKAREGFSFLDDCRTPSIEISLVIEDAIKPALEKLDKKLEEERRQAGASLVTHIAEEAYFSLSERLGKDKTPQLDIRVNLWEGEAGLECNLWELIKDWWERGEGLPYDELEDSLDSLIILRDRLSGLIAKEKADRAKKTETDPV